MGNTSFIADVTRRPLRSAPQVHQSLPGQRIGWLSMWRLRRVSPAGFNAVKAIVEQSGERGARIKLFDLRLLDNLRATDLAPAEITIPQRDTDKKVLDFGLPFGRWRYGELVDKFWSIYLNYLYDKMGDATLYQKLMQTGVGMFAENAAASSTNRPTFVDLGCGTGLALAHLREQFDQFSYVGLDRSLPAVLIARGKISQHLYEEIRRSDAATVLPLKDASVDFVFANHVMLYFSDPESVLREISRVLKPGGKVVFSTPLKGGSVGDVVRGLVDINLEQRGRVLGSLNVAWEILQFLPQISINIIVAISRGVAPHFGEDQQFWNTAISNAGLAVSTTKLGVYGRHHAIFSAKKPETGN